MTQRAQVSTAILTSISARLPARLLHRHRYLKAKRSALATSFNVACFVGGIFGVAVTGDPVVVDSNGQLGVAPAGSPMSANELLKQQRVVQELKATTERQAAVIALQEGQIKTLTAGLKQQADQIQKVSAQLEMVRPTPRVVENR